MNLTNHNSSYTMNMYVSKCQYWDEKQVMWSSVGCEVSLLRMDTEMTPLFDLGWIVDKHQIHRMSVHSFDNLWQ